MAQIPKRGGKKIDDYFTKKSRDEIEVQERKTGEFNNTYNMHTNIQDLQNKRPTFSDILTEV